MKNIMDGAFWMSIFSIPFLLAGMVALGILTILLMTSNVYSMKKMKKYWKMLHRLVYPLLLLVVIHVILI